MPIDLLTGTGSVHRPNGALREIIEMKRIFYALTGLVFTVAAALGAGLPLLPSTSQYSEPSQIVGTINALIQQLNGQQGYATAGTNVSLGSFCQSAAGATPRTCAGQRGTASFTSLAIGAAATTETVVITNANVTAASVCNAFWITAFTAGSGITVATVTPTAGSLSIVSANAGATTNTVTTGTLGFNCVN
jgi:hypothetical protein